jgi:hypothetical protein
MGMNRHRGRAFQIFALCLSLGMLTWLACRAQSKSSPPPADVNANPAASAPDAGAAPDAAAAPEVYFPASKSGGAFLQHQQAPNQ